MDKFGIFNLLSSFFPQNSFSQKAESNQSNTFSPLLTNLLSSLTAKNQSPSPAPENQKQANPAIEKAEKILVKPPLQDQMLNTMINHDKFVQKVKKANPTYKI